MRVYRVQGPDGRIYKLEGPEGATEDQVVSALQEQLAAQPLRPDRTLTEAFTRGASRGYERMKSTLGDVVPAMAASALGFDRYAKDQMEEAAQSERALQETNPAEFNSYKQVDSPYSALKYAAETIGETTPDIAASLLPGGVGGVIGRRAALSGARAVGPLLPATEAAVAATGVARGQIVGTYLGSYAQTAPEIFQGIYQETGQLEPGASALFGSVSAALDSVLPAQILRGMSAPAKIGIIEKILERSGMEPSLLRKVISQIPGSALKEGATEGAQEAINIAAEKFVNENASLWGSKEWERMVESGVRGSVAGGAFGAVGSVGERGQERSEENKAAAIKAQQEQTAADAAEQARIAQENIPQQVETDVNKIPQEVAPGILKAPASNVYTIAETSEGQVAGRELPRPAPAEGGALEMVGSGAPNIDVNQGVLPGMPVELNQPAPEAVAPEVEKPMPAVLTPEILSATGLSKQSGFYKRLVNLDLMTLPGLDAMVQANEEIKANNRIAPETKEAFNTILTQAFNLHAQQGEMFGPRGAVAPGAVEPKPAPLSNAQQKIQAVVEGKDLNDPATVKDIVAKLTAYGERANGANATEIEDFLNQLETSVPKTTEVVNAEPTRADFGAADFGVSEPVVKKGVPAEATTAPDIRGVDVSEGPAGLPSGREELQQDTLTGEQIVPEAPQAVQAKEERPQEPAAPAAAPVVAEGKIPLRDAITRLVKESNLSRADAVEYINQVSDSFGGVDPADIEAEIKNNPKAKYSQAPVGTKGISVDKVKQIVAQMKATWKNAPNIIEVQSISDLPQELQDQIARDKVNPRGAYDPDTKSVYLIADNLRSGTDVAITLAHEALGHFGLQTILGAKFTETMLNIYKGNAGVRARADVMIAEGMDKATAVEEVLSEYAQEVYDKTATDNNYKINTLQKIVNMIRKFFADMGYPLKGISDSEVRGLIAQSRAYVVEGKGRVGSGRVAAKGIKFSAREQVNGVGQALNGLPPFTNGLKESALNAWSKMPDVMHRATMGMFSLPQIEQMFKSVLPSISKLNFLLAKHGFETSNGREHIARNITKWDAIAKKHAAVLPKFFEIANETTRLQVDPLSKEFANNPLTKRFESLPPELQGVYKELRKEYDTYSEQLIQMIEQNLTGDAAKKARAQFESKRLKVYLPFRRFGDYWLTYTDKTGERVVEVFNSPRERDMGAQKATTAGGKDFQNHAKLSQVSYKSQPPTGFMGDVISAMAKNKVSDATMNDVYQAYLSYFPAESLRQQFRTREGGGVKGFSQDILQAYADVAPKMSRQLNNLKFAPEIDNAFSAIKQEATTTPTVGARDVVAEIEKRIDSARNPTMNTAVDYASYTSYMMYIAGNVSSALINLTQLPMVVYPMLGGKYGFDKAASAMKVATAAYWQGGRDTNTDFLPDHTFGVKATGDRKALYEAALANGVLTRSTGYEINEARKSKTEDFTGTRAKIQHGLSWVFQNSERANREITLIAAFDLAKASGKSTEAAIQEALQLTTDSHGAAMFSMGPRLFQQGLGKVIFTFKRFAQTQIYLQARLFNEAFREADAQTRSIARRQLLGIAGMTYLFAGVQGMPLYGGLSLLANMLMNDDDEPFDLDATVRAAIGDLGYKGPLNQLINLDIASRTGFNGMLWREDPKRLSEVGPVSYVLEKIAGPAYGVAKGIERGVGLFREGELERGLEAVSPSFLRNLMTSMRFATEGALTKDGVPIVDDVNAYNTLMQVFGFNPADVAEAGARAGAKKTAEIEIKARKKSLLDKLDGARMSGDVDGEADIREQMARFSEKNPEIPITSSTIEKSFSQRRAKERDSVDGISLDKKTRARIMDVYGE